MISDNHIGGNRNAQQQNSSNVNSTTGPTTPAAAAAAAAISSPGDGSDGALLLDRHAQQAYYAPRAKPYSPPAGYGAHDDDGEFGFKRCRVFFFYIQP
jgi:hypothetical protein